MVGAALMISGILATPLAPLGSVTENVGVKFPEAVGVPARRPLELRDIPFGRPAADHVGEPESPAAVRFVLGYGSLTVDAGSEVVVIRGAIVSEKAIELMSGVGELSVTWTVKVETVAVFAVPEIVPSDARPIPAGRFPLTRAKLYGVVPPDADSATEYETVAVPDGNGLLLVMLTCAARLERNANPSMSDFVTAWRLYSS
jgi:hypothetical protein